MNAKPINTQTEMMRAIRMLNDRRVQKEKQYARIAAAVLTLNIVGWYLISPTENEVPRVTVDSHTVNAPKEVFESKIVPTASEKQQDTDGVQVKQVGIRSDSQTQLEIDGRTVAIPNVLISSIVSMAEASPSSLERSDELVNSTRQIAQSMLGDPAPRPKGRKATGESNKFVPGLGVSISEQYQYFDELIGEGVPVDLGERYRASQANNKPASKKGSKAASTNQPQEETARGGIQTLAQLDTALSAVHEQQRYVETEYGEVMLLDDVIKSESSAQVPHSKARGKYIGSPVTKRSERVREAARQKIPLTPAERIYFSKLADEDERAVNATPDVEQRTVNISYVDGDTPTITIAKNNIGTVSFTDKRGNPYQISRIAPEKVGELFTTHKVESEGNVSNVAEIQGYKLNGSSNISVMLEGRTLPLLFKVNLTQTVNDGKTVVKMNSVAPGFENVSLPEPKTGTAACSADKSVIDSVLDGVIPLDMVRLDTPAHNVQAFTAHGNNYIRSYNEIVTPDCSCLEYGVDNLNVCRMPSNVSVFLMMDKETEKLTTVKLDTKEG